MALLEIDDLRVAFKTRSGLVEVVHGVSLSVERGETVALVGESGSGKTVTAYSVLQLLPERQGFITGGRVMFSGQCISSLSPAQMRSLRGNRIAMIFQEPLTALNPVHTIGAQIAEAVCLHNEVSRKQAWALAVELLERVGIPAPIQRARDYPHQISGGQRQRVVIAIALACEPDLLIADEPTTALDVTTQAQILDLLQDLQAERGMGLLLITHDLGVVAEVASRAAVMQAGRIVEQGAVTQIFSAPAHVYTVGLLAASMEWDDVPYAPVAALPGASFALPHATSTSPKKLAVLAEPPCFLAGRQSYLEIRLAQEEPQGLVP
jgi:ABC-type dipeptide/oligopeptide/nickel transport system ATPase component